MNKKSAFIVVVQLRKKMVFIMENNYSNVMFAASNLLEEIEQILKNYGMNIRKANKPTSN